MAAKKAVRKISVSFVLIDTEFLVTRFVDIVTLQNLLPRRLCEKSAVVVLIKTAFLETSFSDFVTLQNLLLLPRELVRKILDSVVF